MWKSAGGPSKEQFPAAKAGPAWVFIDLDLADYLRALYAAPRQPLNLALELLSKLVGKHATHVFSFRGNPITQVSMKTWYNALERAGIQKFRWHDFRHTWASWHVQGGTPLFALQELGDLGYGAALCPHVG